MNKEEILNLTVKTCILDNWKAKLSYPLNYKDLEELERIIDYYEEHQNNLIKQLDQQEQIIREAREYVEKFVPIDNDTILMRERQRDYLLEILDRNVK